MCLCAQIEIHDTDIDEKSRKASKCTQYIPEIWIREKIFRHGPRGAFFAALMAGVGTKSAGKTTLA